MLDGSLEDNVLTALCWSESLAPQIIQRGLEARDFSTDAYRQIASAGLGFYEKHQRPARAHIGDVLEEELKRGNHGRYLQELIGDMERLAPLLVDDFVLGTLDKFLTIQRKTKHVEAASQHLLNGDIAAANASLWQGINIRIAEPILGDPWGEPMPPRFDPAPLPKLLRQFVNERARATGCDPAGIFWAALSCCSAAIDGSTRLQMGLDASYAGFRVPPAIWVLLFGAASIGRTPMLNSAWEPLRRVDSEAGVTHQQAVAAWKKLKALDGAAEAGEPPARLHYILNDITPEFTGAVLAKQDRGVALYADEWAAMIGQWDRYGASGGALVARKFMIECYDGGSGNIGRIGRGFMSIKNKQVVCCGGIQPLVLRGLNSGRDKLTDDGLLQRMVMPICRPKQLSDDEIPGRETELYAQLIKDLTRIEGGQTIKLNAEARKIRMRVEQRLEPWVKNDSLGLGFMSFAGKMLGLWGRLTLNLGLIMHLEVNRGSLHLPEEFGEKPAELAQQLIFEQVLAHGAKVYNWLGGGGDLAITQAIAGWLLTHRHARLTPSDLTRGVHPLRGLTTTQLADAVSPLIALGWLSSEDNRRQSWRVDQHLYLSGQFQEKAQQEARQRDMLHQYIVEQASPSHTPSTEIPAGASEEAETEIDADASMHPEPLTEPMDPEPPRRRAAPFRFKTLRRE